MNPFRSQTLISTACVTQIATIIMAAGCSQTHYRLQADRQVNALIDEKSPPAGAVPGEYRIAINQASRMFDPYNPDCEPQPPDDPVSHRYMECVDCKFGSTQWKKLPKTPYTDNPNWPQYLPRDSEGQVAIDQQGAVRLALLQSPDYQQELEDLYLSALDVTFERFRFDTQFFGGSDVFYTASGRDRGGVTAAARGGASNSELQVSPLRPGNRLRAERLTATGGELVVGLANSLVWQFAGPGDYTSNTLLDFAIVQPLLRRGGRTRVLERLTISERALLANVRIMERFQRGFYLSVVTGRNAGAGPSRRGGFFGGAGLEGFTGVGGGGFGRVGGFGGGFGGVGAGGGFTGGAGAAGADGYIGLLQRVQVIRNQRANVARLLTNVEQLEATYDAGRIDRFQVDQVQQALYNAQSQLLTAENSYQAEFENFKVDLGLPPELPLKLTDPLLQRFELLPTETETLQVDVAMLLETLRETLQDESADPASAEMAAVLSGLGDEVERITVAAQQQVAAVRADFALLQENLPKRRRNLQRLAKRPDVLAGDVDVELFDVAALDRRFEQLKRDITQLETQFKSTFAALETLTQQTDQPAAVRIDRLATEMNQLNNQLLELSLAQARARLDGISFDPIDLTPEQALTIANAYRRDWMNARAALVDSWRLIYFNANDLLSDLDILFSGDLGNVGDNPFRLRSTRGRLRAGLQFDAPLTRLAERNIYRQSLIEYQQARRQYYQFRDRIYQSLRNTLRQLRLDEVNFELRRAAVQVAISQVDLTQLRLFEPPRPGETTEQLGATTARDLVQSLNDLLNVQNDFLSVWVDYEVQRLNLDFDLGIMELDRNGLRVEHGVPPVMFLNGICESATEFSSLDPSCPPASCPAGLAPPPLEPLRLPRDLESLPAPSGTLLDGMGPQANSMGRNTSAEPAGTTRISLRPREQALARVTAVAPIRESGRRLPPVPLPSTP